MSTVDERLEALEVTVREQAETITVLVAKARGYGWLPTPPQAPRGDQLATLNRWADDVHGRAQARGWTLAESMGVDMTTPIHLLRAMKDENRQVRRSALPARTQETLEVFFEKRCSDVLAGTWGVAMVPSEWSARWGGK